MYYSDLVGMYKNLSLEEIKSMQECNDMKSMYDPKGEQSYILLILTRLLPDLVYDITTLEHINVTVPEIMTLIEGITVGGHRVSDIDSTNNIIRAYKYIIQLVKRGESVNLEDLYRTLHAILAVNLVDHPGMYRISGIRVGGAPNWVCPNSFKLNLYVTELLEEFHSSQQDVYAVMKLFCQLVYLQPFEDCNKRTARVLANYLLVSNRLGIFSVHHTLVPEFNVFLVEAFNTVNLNKLIGFLVDKCVMRFDGREIVKDFYKREQKTSIFSQQ